MKKALRREKKRVTRIWRNELIAMKRAKGDAMRWTFLVWSIQDDAPASV